MFCTTKVTNIKLVKLVFPSKDLLTTELLFAIIADISTTAKILFVTLVPTADKDYLKMIKAILLNYPKS
jgi:hypothetical protein